MLILTELDTSHLLYLLREHLSWVNFSLIVFLFLCIAVFFRTNRQKYDIIEKRYNKISKELKEEKESLLRKKSISQILKDEVRLSLAFEMGVPVSEVTDKHIEDWVVKSDEDNAKEMRYKFGENGSLYKNNPDKWHEKTDKILTDFLKQDF